MVVASPQPFSHRPELIAGRYELVELLGEGGMGAIWRARHVALQAPVAIKFLRTSARPPTVHRFW